ncbi:hypothetical protein POVWA2_036050 [Plasmodium ovale wallikeri]|uniref:Uncharacterized protein n=1 Tax=Plasmodium ovale wallikeri TaxID=864142 RepID=A0A1A8Z3Z7_PLAOA|nr:hypothetical protein POVWA1_036750 [Plasmodium ovale wallikeri]SBT38591.1 hypothetical protein POVWA2_036050 [Plasmodium ovale wallikeri]
MKRNGEENYRKNMLYEEMRNDINMFNMFIKKENVKLLISQWQIKYDLYEMDKFYDISGNHLHFGNIRDKCNYLLNDKTVEEEENNEKNYTTCLDRDITKEEKKLKCRMYHQIKCYVKKSYQENSYVDRRYEGKMEHNRIYEKNGKGEICNYDPYLGNPNGGNKNREYSLAEGKKKEDERSYK